MRESKAWRWGILFAATAIALIVVVQVVLAHASPIFKGRVIETLQVRFGSEVQLDTLQVSMIHGLAVTGTGLRIFPPGNHNADVYTRPLIAIKQFQFRASPVELFFKPTFVHLANVRGPAIDLPPASQRANSVASERHDGKIKIRVNEVVCADSVLIIETDKPNKDPRIFQLKQYFRAITA